MIFDQIKRIATGSCMGLAGLGVAIFSPVDGFADGNALQFDGQDDYVTMGDTLGQSEFTISLWMKKTGDGVGASTGSGGINAIPLVSKGRGENDNSTLDCNYFFGIDTATGVLGADFEEGAAGAKPGLNHPVLGTTVIEDGAWYHAALTYDGDEWRIYLNGQLEAKLYTGQPLREDSIQHFGFGAAMNSTGAPEGAFEGLMDEVSVWDVALDEAGILELMFDSPAPGALGLDGYWKLDEVSEGKVSDELGLNDGELILFTTPVSVESGYDRSTVVLPPVGLAARFVGLDDVSLSWSEVFGASGEVVVERSVEGSGSWSEVARIAAGVGSYVDAGLYRDTVYAYRVRSEGSLATSNIVIVPSGTGEGFRVSSFRYGVNNYYTTQDIALQEVGGVGPDGTWNDVTIYADNNVGDEHMALVQFLDLVGTQGAQLPVGVEVKKATLRLWVGGGANRTNNSLSLYKMLDSWDQSSTWNTMVDGVSTDGVEAASVADHSFASFAINNAWSEWDVTQTIQDIVNGSASNNGWVLRNSGADGFGFVCSESKDIGIRPELLIEYKLEELPVPPADLAVSYDASKGVQLSWTDLASNESFYTVERAGSVSGPWLRITSLAAGSTSYLDTTALESEEYFYRVSAANASGGAFGELVAIRTGSLPTGLEFDGSDDYVTMGDSLGMSELTISLWFQKTGAGSTAGTGVGGITAVPLVTKGRGESDGSNVDCNYFFGIIGSTGTLGVDFEEGASGPNPGLNHPASGVTLIENDRWYHAVASYDGDYWRIYLNGTLESETYIGRPLRADSIQHFGLGTAMNSSGTPSGAFEGRMDEVSLWSRALDLSEIRALMLGDAEAAASGLAGYWKLDSLDGAVALDELGSNPGTLVNMGSEDWVVIDREVDAFVYAPSGLAAANIALGKVALTWQDETSNESGFILERAPAPEGPWETLASLSANVESYTDSSLEVGMQYYYRVRPTDNPAYSNLARANGGTRTGLLSASFRHGENNYQGTQDVGIRQSNNPGPDAPWNVAEVYTDNNSASDEDQVLIRFNDLAGAGPGQLVSDSVIHKATLRLWVGGGNNRTNNSISLHRMMKGWTDTSSWNSLVDGVTANDVEARSAADETKNGVPLVNEWSEWDVSDSVRAYIASEESNFGWVLLNSGSDGFGIWNMETPDVSQRPELVIEYSFGPTPELPAKFAALPTSDNSIALRWQDASGETSYSIERSEDAEGPWLFVSEGLAADTESFVDTGLAADTTYFYRLIALNENGGTASDIAAARTDDHPYGLRTLSFRNGQNGYEGNLDIGISHLAADTTLASEMLWVDNNSETDETQVLLRFDDIFGEEVGRIPSDTKVEKAYIRIYVSTAGNAQSNGPMHFHQMLVDWDGSSVWDSATWGSDGVDEDGVEAFVQPDSVAQFSTPDTYYLVDVTASFDRWLSGSENYGWLITTYSSDGYLYSSSRMESVEQRPELVVLFDTDSTNVYPELTKVNSPLPNAVGVSEPATLDFEVADANDDALDVKLYGRKIRDVGTEPDFSVVLLPDTQFYSAEINGAVAEIFKSQTDWIIENREKLNIAFVLHLGDIVQNGDVMGNGSSAEYEWINAANALYQLEDPTLTGLEEGIPYGVAVGNHDQEPIWDPNGTTTYYNKYFGKEHFQDKSYYGDNYGDNNDNYYQLYTVGAFKFLSISLEYRGSADSAILEWADNLIKAYPDRRVIITTHHMVNTGNPASWSPYGEAIYETLKDNTNLDLLLGGHIHGEGRRTDTYNGSVVHSLLQDYQGYNQGGNGFLRILNFSPSRNKIFVSTYSPWASAWETDADSEFELDYDLGADLQLPELLAQFDHVVSGSRLSWVWDELKAGSQYEWFVELFDGRKTKVSDSNLFTAAGSTYSSFRDRVFGTEEKRTGRDEDFDSDGFNNYYEFVFNSDVRSGQGAHMPTVALGSGSTKVHYERVKDAGLIWNYKISQDLINWVLPDASLLTIEETVVANDDGTETVDLVIDSKLETVFWKIVVE